MQASRKAVIAWLALPLPLAAGLRGRFLHPLNPPAACHGAHPIKFFLLRYLIERLKAERFPNSLALF